MPIPAARPVSRSSPTSWMASVSRVDDVLPGAGVRAEHQDPDHAVVEVDGLGRLDLGQAEHGRAAPPRRAVAAGDGEQSASEAARIGPRRPRPSARPTASRRRPASTGAPSSRAHVVPEDRPGAVLLDQHEAPAQRHGAAPRRPPSASNAKRTAAVAPTTVPVVDAGRTAARRAGSRAPPRRPRTRAPVSRSMSRGRVPCRPGGERRRRTPRSPRAGSRRGTPGRRSATARPRPRSRARCGSARRAPRRRARSRRAGPPDASAAGGSGRPGSSPGQRRATGQHAQATSTDGERGPTRGSPWLPPHHRGTAGVPAMTAMMADPADSRLSSPTPS